MLPKKKESDKQKTLIINLENTLVHYQMILSSDEGWPPEASLRFIVNNRIYQGDIRPGALDFLKSINQTFEVVILSTSH